MQDIERNMSEQTAKEGASTATLNENRELEEVDMEIFQKIKDCCAPKQKGRYACRKAAPMRQMEYELDPTVACHMVCDPEQLQQHILRMVRNGQHTDIKVNVHGQVFNCHRVVLRILTNYFKNTTVFECAYITSEQVTPLGFELAYKWMSNMDDVPQRQHIVELYMAARYLEMPELEELLWHDFENRELFNEAQAFELFLETLAFEQTPLQQLLLTRISRYFLTAVASEEYLTLNAQAVQALLSSNVIAVNSELEIFMCAIRWLYYDWAKRKQHLPLLMSTVRFHLMPPRCLLSLKGKQSDDNLLEICADPFVQQRINEGLSYSVAHRALSTEKSPEGVCDREWIIDEQAAHHHLNNCPNWRPLDFTQFCSYLEQVINAGPLGYTRLKAKNEDNLMGCCQAKQNTTTTSD